MAEQSRPPQQVAEDDENKNEDVQLCVRYPSREWTVFDDTNVSASHQKKGLELFIESGLDSMDVSIPHADGGLFMVEFGKNTTKNEETGENITIYHYIKTNMQTVQMMYAKPSYIAYINRIVGHVD